MEMNHKQNVDSCSQEAVPRSVFEIPRPPNPFLGLGAARLKSQNSMRNISFVDKDIAKFVGSRDVSPAERMRVLDDIRKHSPTEKESLDLNIPRDRLSLEGLKDVMFLSGGCSGGRFSTEELDIMRNAVGKLQLQNSTLNQLYDSFSSDIRRNVPSSEELVDSVLEFYQASDYVLNSCMVIQEFVRNKNKTLASNDRLIISKDPDGLSGSMKPRWFEVLLSKYNLFVAQLEAKGDIRHLKVTSGKFACFLGLCVFGQIGCNEQEKDAIFELLEASNDDTCPIYAHLSFEKIVSLIRCHSLDYWTRRIFNFVKSVCSTMPEDVASLHEYDVFLLLLA